MDQSVKTLDDEGLNQKNLRCVIFLVTDFL